MRKKKGGRAVKTVRKLSEVLEFLEDREISPEDVVIDRKAIRIIKANEEDEPDLDGEE